MELPVTHSHPSSHAGLWASVQALLRWLRSPTILVEWSVKPRWHVALRHARMLTILLAYSLAWYWFGGLQLAQPAAPPTTTLARADGPPVAAPQTQPPAPALAEDDIRTEDAAGLRIDAFRIGVVSGYPNRLHYELALSNKGRKLVGKLRFMVVGEQDGEIHQLPLSAATAPAGASPQLEVSRRLHTRGFLDLPAGYITHKVVVQVMEGDTLRVSHSAPMWPV